AGEYSVIVTDSETPCISIDTAFTISEGITYSKIEASLPCDVDSMVNVGVNISSDYSSILWNNGETTETISVGMPGNYAFTITPTDPDCDPIRDSIRISNQGGGVWITSFDDGIPNPCITEGIVFFSLNLPLADFGISWDDGPIVVAGNSYMVHDDELHNLKVYKDDCIVIDTNFILEFPNALTVYPIVFNVTGFGESDGQITTKVSGEFGNY